MRNHIVIIGSGLMGSSIGAMSALAGNPTVLVDLDEQRARAGLERACDCIALRLENGLSTAEKSERAKTLLTLSTNLTEALSSARLVIEAVSEKLEVKQNLFCRLDALLPAEVPICSNTSGLRITEISALCHHPERTFTTHFWLPAHLVPLVEVVMGDHSDRGMVNSVIEEMKLWGKAARTGAQRLARTTGKPCVSGNYPRSNFHRCIWSCIG